MLRVLCENAADVNLRHETSGATVLIQVCAKGYHHCLETLCSFGADLNIQDKLGTTALMAACEKGHPECVLHLCERRAHLDAENEYRMTALQIASFKGHEEIVDTLCRFGADLNLSDRERKTALMLATKEGHDGCVKLLLEHGADRNALNSYGKKAVDYAPTRQLRELLLTHGGPRESRDGPTLAAALPESLLLTASSGAILASSSASSSSSSSSSGVVKNSASLSRSSSDTCACSRCDCPERQAERSRMQRSLGDATNPVAPETSSSEILRSSSRRSRDESETLMEPSAEEKRFKVDS